jgi:hypothetical protein
MGLDWLKYFDTNTITRTKGIYRLLVFDRYKNYNSVAFQEYYTEYNIKVLCLPPYSSYLTQLADIGLFQLLKKVYRYQVDNFIKSNITYIDKANFLVGFQGIFKKAIISKNTKTGFYSTRLVLFDPKEVISRIDIRLQSPLPTTRSSSLWSLYTLYNSKEALSQTNLIRDRITWYQSSSPISLFRAIEALAKGTERLVYKITFLCTNNQRLHKANYNLNKHRRASKVYLKQNKAITTEEALDLLSQKEVVDQIQGNNAPKGENPEEVSSTQPQYRIYKQPGYNKRICPNRLIDPALVTSI